MSKYDPLRRFLRRRRGETVCLTFEEIERIIGGILPHAAKEAAWWSNNRPSGRTFVQCHAWLDAGYQATPATANGAVCFRQRERLGET